MYSLTKIASSEIIGETETVSRYPMQMDLKERILTARTEAGMTQEQLAEAVGKTRGAVAQWESGDVRPRHSTLAAIAKATDKTMRWLESGLTQESAFLMAVGEVAAGLWKEGHVEYKQVPMPVAPHPAFPAIAQRLYKVSGTSLNRIAADGAYLHTVDIHVSGIAPQNGDLVVVRRQRHDTAEYTAKRLVISGGLMVLAPESMDPAWQEPIQFDGDESANPEITDIVIAIWSPTYRVTNT